VSPRASWWLRLVVFIFAVVELAPGLWAVIDPRGFYDNFPGLGRHWVSVDGPFNHHLVTDAGAGFLAVGAVLLFAAVFFDRRVVQVGLVALLAKELPHLVYHLTHTPSALSGSDIFLGTGGIAVEVAVAGVMLALVTRVRTLQAH
jgi:hypothetical protein